MKLYKLLAAIKAIIATLAERLAVSPEGEAHRFGMTVMRRIDFSDELVPVHAATGHRRHEQIR
jgi:hypothetical protein